MVEAFLFALGLPMLSAGPAQEGEPFIELFTSSAIGDPAGEVVYVFADGEAPEGEELHVLSRRGRLGTFRIVGDEAVPVPSPHLSLPDDLGAGRNWVFASASIGDYGPEATGTLYQRFFPPGADAVRPGSWGVLASADGTTAFFVRGGTEVEHPAEVAVVDVDADGSEDLERFVVVTPELPRIQSSENGDLVVVQTSQSVEIRGASPIPQAEAIPPGGRVHLQPDARWLVREDDTVVELRRVSDGHAVPLAIRPPLMDVEFKEEHVLLVGRERAELFDLSADELAQPLVAADATPGHRFSSAALYPRGSGATPWIALGELAVVVPQLALPDAPQPKASAVTRSVDRDGTTVERWELPVDAWRGNTPFVQWSEQGRLIASTKGRVVVSAQTYQ
jgi:hypothetical protein